MGPGGKVESKSESIWNVRSNREVEYMEQSISETISRLRKDFTESEQLDLKT